jgi:hypothetical protein
MYILSARHFPLLSSGDATRPRCGAGEGERAGSAPRGFPTAIWLVSWAPELRVPGWRLAGRQASAHSWQRVAPRRQAHILEGGRGRESERKREKEREESSERARARGGGEITPRLRCPLCARATQPRWASVASEAGCHTGARPDTQRARVWHDARACSARSLCDFSKSGMASSASPSYSPQKPMSLMSDANNSMDSFALDDVDATVGIMVWPGKRKRWGRRRAQRRMCAFVPERMTR